MMSNQYCIKKMILEGLYEICPLHVTDFRGESIKDFSFEIFSENDIDFYPKEILTIKSKGGVLRGLHFQRKQIQNRIIRCISGNVWAVVVDIAPESKSFGKWISIDINNGSEAYIPGSYALGTLAMEDSILLCSYDEKYINEYSDGVLWNDKQIGINWPLNRLNYKLTISDKDKKLKCLEDYSIFCRRESDA